MLARSILQGVFVAMAASQVVGQFDDESMFNGQDLAGWSGDLRYWSVEDGAITGRSTAERPLVATTYLFWEGVVEDFDLRLKYRIQSGNSGVQYRSRMVGEFDVAGYQADIEAGPNYTGILYEAGGREIMVGRGEQVHFQGDERVDLDPIGDAAELLAHVLVGDWNEYTIIAEGPRLTHIINGQVMMRAIDEDLERRRLSGQIALQLHAGDPMMVQFKDFELRRLGGQEEQISEWIWRNEEPGEGERCFFRRVFELGEEAESAKLLITCDNSFTAYLNGVEVASGSDWMRPVHVEVGGLLQVGTNVLSVNGTNEGGPAALAARLDIRSGDGSEIRIVTDGWWRVAAEAEKGWKGAGFDDGAWGAAHSFGPVTGARGPWPDLFSPRTATPVSSIHAPEGYEVELLASAGFGQGSWVCMTFDDRGRVIISPEAGPLFRAEILGDGSAEVVQLDTPVGDAQGLLYAYDSLYVNVSHDANDGGGLHRLRDTDGDGDFDQHEHLKAMGSRSEHGNHGIALGPDGMLYFMHGNYVPLPEGVSATSPHRNWGEDVLLERIWDPRGHAIGIMSPGAHVLRTDRDGKEWEIVAAGMRNPYDLAFNSDGELFTVDADMEWDIGAPWYRPVRAIHVVSGGEYGWRGGTGKWPAYYADSLPAMVDLDLGSPTGTVFGTKSKFPWRYKQALFVGDWAYGCILAVHLKQNGATYDAQWETFISGKPLNVTDMEFGPDGAMYFITGGRGTQSGLYRVRYVGARADLKGEPTPPHGQQGRASRLALEDLHGDVGPEGLDFAWEGLASGDRWVRYAARVAVEHQDPGLWAERALGERDWTASVAALIALARVGDRALKAEILKSLNRLPIAVISEDDQLALLRAYMLVFTRMGAPDEKERQNLLVKLDPLYASAKTRTGRELSRILTYLDAPRVVPRTLNRIRRAKTQEEALHYALMLRLVEQGWTERMRVEYFKWLNEAKGLTGGLSLAGFVEAIEATAMGQLSKSDRNRIEDLLAQDHSEEAADEPVAQKRGFVRAWSMGDLLGDLDRVGSERSFDKAKIVFTEATCIDCHRIAGVGGVNGPDLTGASGRFSRRDLLETILSPSRDISDQYQQVEILASGGVSVIGRIIEQNNEKIVLLTNAVEGTRQEIRRQDVRQVRKISLSQMPAGLLNSFTKEEILDLLAFIEAGGDSRSTAFE